MSEEELQREIVSDAFSMQVADCERNIRIQFEKLQQENQQLKDRINKAVEYMDKMTEKELNYITYKGEEYLVCGSDFSDGAWIIEEILKGDKE